MVRLRGPRRFGSGVAQRALTALRPGGEVAVVGPEGAKSVAVQHVVRSFDPCMVCTAH